MQNHDLAQMIDRLRSLMAREEGKGNFVYPSLLREVPSITLPYVGGHNGELTYGELGRNFEGNYRSPKEGSFSL